MHLLDRHSIRQCEPGYPFTRNDASFIYKLCILTDDVTHRGMGSLNEFTIAHDEGKIIGCLTGTGGVADEVDYLIEKFGKRGKAVVFKDEDPEKLMEKCFEAAATET